jgi:RNA polymerase sigma factor (sigma-70 family)
MANQGKLILVVARRARLDETEREEVFQNACLSAYKAIGSLRDPTRLTAWVYSIAYHHVLDLVRSKRREAALRTAGPGEGLEAGTDAAALGPEILEQYERARHVREAMENLDPRCRRLISGLFLAEPPMTYDELSARESIPLGSIGPTRARCLRKLRRALRRVFSAAAPPSTGRANWETSMESDSTSSPTRNRW